MSSDWGIERLSYVDAPFVWPDHWERMRRNMSQREWQRRGLAMDVGPELMVYTGWRREENLIPIPRIGAEDVTSQVLRRWAPNAEILVGHDPGQLFDVSVLLKAYKVRGMPDPFVWFIVGEVTTEQTTTEQHVAALLAELRDRWNVQQVDRKGRPVSDAPTAFVRADPHGNTDARPDRSVYNIFKRNGLRIMPAAYAPNGTKPGRVPKEAGIEVVNSLFCNAASQRRLYVAQDENGRPCAERTVEAIELSERDADGKAEAQKKNRKDLSHWTASVRYALWAIERVRLGSSVSEVLG